MQIPFLGELVALLVSFCWAASSSSFEIAGRKVGSLEVNVLRLIVAFLMLGVCGLFVRGAFLPTGAGVQQWVWLSVSGVIGFFLGDLCLFSALTQVGARLTMLVMTFSPALTVLIGFFLLGESLTWIHLLGILCIVLGILMAFFHRQKGGQAKPVTVKGLLYALGGALGQSFGLIYSKKGIGHFDPFAATQIRIIAGFACYAVLVTLLGSWRSLRVSVRDTPAMKWVVVGSFFGPGLGVGLSMMAITLTDTGIASALMSLTPLVLIVPNWLRGRRTSSWEILGAFVSVLGVLTLFLL
jgi:drug/metabolite transporter (DMT)-like permease